MSQNARAGQPLTAADAAADGNEVHLQVGDTGQGVDPAFIPHLFAMYHQHPTAGAGTVPVIAMSGDPQFRRRGAGAARGLRDVSAKARGSERARKAIRKTLRR
jgi:hypothetical protein